VSDTLFNGDPVEVVNLPADPIPVIPFAQKTPFAQLLSSNGDGTGTTNAKGNYSTGSPGIFYLQPPAGQVWCLTSLPILITDDGALDAGRYGDALVLTNGFLLEVKSGATVKLDLCGGLPILTNADWGRCGATPFLIDWGVGDDSLAVILNFTQLYGLPLRLVGDNNDRLQLTVRDNTANIVSHYLQAMGYKE
jgi:hypothetical protein